MRDQRDQSDERDTVKRERGDCGGEKRERETRCGGEERERTVWKMRDD